MVAIREIIVTGITTICLCRCTCREWLTGAVWELTHDLLHGGIHDAHCVYLATRSEDRIL